MAKDINQTIISGNLVADPELRYTPSGHAVANARIASNKPFQRNDEWEDDTTFVTFTVWRDKAERLAEFFRKGMRVIVTGRLKTESWTNDAGDQRSKLTLDAYDFQPMGRWGDLMNDGDSDGGAAPRRKPDPEMDIDDIPF